MQSLEHELIEKFRLLDKDAQRRVRALIEQELESDFPQGGETGFDYDAWFHDVEDLRQEMLSRHGGKLPSIDVVGLLRDIRDSEDE
jgi:hypothetical protein